MIKLANFISNNFIPIVLISLHFIIMSFITHVIVHAPTMRITKRILTILAIICPEFVLALFIITSIATNVYLGLFGDEEFYGE